ncbi:MAG: hypothetical protein ACRCZH_03725 [Cetobacterium sp.]
MNNYVLGPAKIMIGDVQIDTTLKDKPVTVKMGYKDYYVKPKWSNEEKEKRIRVKADIVIEFTTTAKMDMLTQGIESNVVFIDDSRVTIDGAGHRFIFNRCDVVEELTYNFKDNQLSEYKYTITPKLDVDNQYGEVEMYSRKYGIGLYGIRQYS